MSLLVCVSRALDCGAIVDVTPELPTFNKGSPNDDMIGGYNEKIRNAKV